MALITTLIEQGNCCLPSNTTKLKDCYPPCEHNHDQLYYRKEVIDNKLESIELSEGSQTYFGIGTPNSLLGKISDIYIDTQNDMFYKKNSTSWGLEYSITIQIPDLQEVTDAGFTTTNGITIASLNITDSKIIMESALSSLVFNADRVGAVEPNTIAMFTRSGGHPAVRSSSVVGSWDNFAQLNTRGLLGKQTFSFPNKSGTFALIDDLNNYITKGGVLPTDLGMTTNNTIPVRGNGDVWIYRSTTGVPSQGAIPLWTTDGQLRVNNAVMNDAAVNLGQLNTAMSGYLPLSGGTMSGDINMGSNEVYTDNFFFVRNGSGHTPYVTLSNFRSTTNEMRLEWGIPFGGSMGYAPFRLMLDYDNPSNGLLIQTPNSLSSSAATTKLAFNIGNNTSSPNITVAQFFGSVLGRMPSSAGDGSGYAGPFATQPYVDAQSGGGVFKKVANEGILLQSRTDYGIGPIAIDFTTDGIAEPLGSALLGGRVHSITDSSVDAVILGGTGNSISILGQSAAILGGDSGSVTASRSVILGGNGLLATVDEMVAIGKYNISPVSGTVFSVGAGTSPSSRANAYTLFSNGTSNQFGGAVFTPATGQGHPSFPNDSIFIGNRVQDSSPVIQGKFGSVTGFTLYSSPEGVDTVSLSLYGGITLSNGGSGDLEIAAIGSGVIIKSPDGSRFRIIVSNAGALSAVAL